ncbi:PadR family transcriptional regulator [Draconibacterium sp. IB214405]|uniref:PadR family transcriptional regulator n=1 Tax=Draconibacterium sp. IB214405 TaxID=3097352 RepID=UPI002A0AD13F|nr:PadR family transcriptional regulator [Draconibacterium sp. IB214405]MDX8339756.1 PadR family transcriptional regulator [Draconibacterium sp. IB214405]
MFTIVRHDKINHKDLFRQGLIYYNMKKFRKDLMGASSIPSILSILRNGDTYGYDINKQLREASEGRIDWKEGSLYPILKKMEDLKYIKSYWEMGDSDRPRKYYKITATGKKAMDESREELIDMVAIMNKLWNPQTDSI